MIGNFLKDESGATAIEYGLMVALIAVSAIAGMQLTGTSVTELHTSNQEQISDAMSSTAQ